jgi:hypothetical protein
VTNDTVRAKKYDQSISSLNGKTKIRYFEIPVMLSYSRQFSRYSFGIRLGTSLGWLNQKATSGYYLNEQSTGLMDLRQQRSSFNHFMVCSIVQMRIGTKISRRCNFYLEPSFKANLGHVYQNNVLNQRYYLAGFYAGVGWRL